MCGRTNWYQQHTCGHRLPLEPCDAYAHLLQQCLADPGELRRFSWASMRRAPRSLENCRFCREGKDIEGEWAYGGNWVGAEGFREPEPELK